MKKRVQNMAVENKTIVLRCDFNVPIKNGEILDDSKIRLSLETINYLLNKNCKLVVLSHLGKVKSEEDKLKNTLEPIAKRLESLLKHKVAFSKDNRAVDLELQVKSMASGSILLLENTRTQDFPNKLESKNDLGLAEFWSSLGDIFVNDAFGSLHRAHASTAGIAKFIPSCVGFLVQKELENLDKYVLNANHPFTVIMGGSKVEDKLPIIEKLIPKCDYLLLGGNLANSFLSVLGFSIGFKDIELSDELKKKLEDLMLLNKDKIMLPLDAIVDRSYEKTAPKYRLINEIDDNDIICDIGIKTLEKYKNAINESKTVFVNGTVGIYEDSRFANGTKEMFKIMKKSKAEVIIGGGDSVSAATNFGYADKFTYLSSGGGASLEYIAYEKLAALDFIANEEDKGGKEIEVLSL